MEINEKRGAPVKMIWMFVTLGLMLVSLVLYLLVIRGDFGRKLENLITGFVPAVLLIGGAGICLSKGSVNLALPGIACMSGFLGSLLLNVDADLAVVAVIVALFAGAASGALNGLFTIQSGKRVLLVTALSSLAVGALLTAIPLVIWGGYVNQTAKIERGAVTLLSILGLLIAAAACILGGLGKHAPTNTGDPAPRPNGGARFLWSVIAGALAGLAGILAVIRLGVFQPTTFSSYNEYTVVPGLLLAGALIPNLRRSTGEGICGGLALLFGGIACYTLTQMLYYTGIDVNATRMLTIVVTILFLIPNLLIGKRKNEAL